MYKKEVSKLQIPSVENNNGISPNVWSKNTSKLQEKDSTLSRNV